DTALPAASHPRQSGSVPHFFRLPAVSDKAEELSVRLLLSLLGSLLFFLLFFLLLFPLFFPLLIPLFILVFFLPPALFSGFLPGLFSHTIHGRIPLRSRPPPPNCSFPGILSKYLCQCMLFSLLPLHFQ